MSADLIRAEALRDLCSYSELSVQDRKLLRNAAAELERLRAELAALREQEPVAEVMSGWSIAWAGREPLATVLARHPSVRIGSKLYAAPIPAAPAQAPDAGATIQDRLKVAADAGALRDALRFIASQPNGDAVSVNTARAALSATPAPTGNSDALLATLEALVNRCNTEFGIAGDESVIAAEAVLERFYKNRRAALAADAGQPTNTKE
jgi:hypothetical protein